MNDFLDARRIAEEETRQVMQGFHPDTISDGDVSAERWGALVPMWCDSLASQIAGAFETYTLYVYMHEICSANPEACPGWDQAKHEELIAEILKSLESLGKTYKYLGCSNTVGTMGS
jgi:hypothetical protein